jgi:cytochrome c-type biogenesis protein CcmH/NrfG
MNNAKKDLNLLFGIIILALAGVAIFAMRRNASLPVIEESPDAANIQLPENHPPLEASRELSELEKMSTSDPQNADYRTRIGNLYYDLGQYQKAIEAYESSLQLRPKDAAVQTDLATCYHLLGQEDKALNLLNEVLKDDPGFFHALFNKGLVLIDGKHDIQGGVAVWEQLLRANPGFPKRAQIEQKIRELKLGK